MPHSIFNSSFRPALIGPLLNAAFSTFILQSKLAPTTWTLNSWLLLHLGSFPLPRLRPFRVRPLYHNAEAAEPARFSGAYSYALLSIRVLWKPILEIVREWDNKNSRLNHDEQTDRFGSRWHPYSRTVSEMRGMHGKLEMILNRISCVGTLKCNSFVGAVIDTLDVLSRVESDEETVCVD